MLAMPCGVLRALLSACPSPCRLLCRPAVILSYLFSGVAALLTAACFAELCLEYPVSGGAFSYVMVSSARSVCCEVGWPPVLTLQLLHVR